ncbi:MAG: SDR family oxidoreductase [Armatimonadota bacterium]
MTISPDRILMTGGGGRLGSEIKSLLPGIHTPDLPDFNITCNDDVDKAFDEFKPLLVIHAAAYTNVSMAEKDKSLCWNVNVEGTRNIVNAAIKRDIFLIHISTDYVFFGDVGMYKEDDSVGPVRNYYSLTKLVAEEIAKMAERRLVIRTSFRPREWPYDTAFTDLFTSQDYVDVIAPEIVLAIQRYDEIPYKLIHIAAERKSVYELASQRKPDVRPASRCDVTVDLPEDISLDISRWKKLKEEWGTL